MFRLWLLFLMFSQGMVSLAQQIPIPYRTLTVADGLPQSFVSSLVQDSTGFIWIATRDGLAKYDGRKFTYFRHERDDIASLSGNIIMSIYLDRRERLWIMQENGTIDLLDTRTEQITRLTENPRYTLLYDNMRTAHSIIEDKQGNYWIISKSGDLFIIDLSKEILHYHPVRSIPHISVGSFKDVAQYGDMLLIVAEKGLLFLDTNLTVKRQIPFHFSNPSLYDEKNAWKYHRPLVRPNGNIIIPDKERLILYSPISQIFSLIPLPEQQMYLPPSFADDNRGNVIIGYGNQLYALDKANQLTPWNDTYRPDKPFASVLLRDRSGVLWQGTSGYGLHLYDLSLKQMPHLSYRYNFPNDILRVLNVPEKQLKTSFVNRLNPYYFRQSSNASGEIWIAKAGPDRVESLNLAKINPEGIKIPNWKFTQGKPDDLCGIDALSIPQNGQFWGIDHNTRLIHFDEENTTAIFHSLVISKAADNRMLEINGLHVIDNQTFWISCSEGLLRHDIKSGKNTSFFGKELNFRLLCLHPDPDNKDILWLGTYTDGLIRFDIRSGGYRSFGHEEGLPNLTVYSILTDANGRLWCSTNKGIFSLDRHIHKVKSYLLQGQDATTEFNRFHYLPLPDGRLAFGGTDGYTVFHPLQLTEDTFTPAIALTGLMIKNRAIDGKTLEISGAHALNDIKYLELGYNQNFLSFEFASLQYNMPDILQYRYKLEGIDKEWVLSGQHNMATYTSLPPGEYELLLNASNTAGMWSTHIKQISITIKPPLWMTWWFRGLSALCIGGLVFYLIRRRLYTIRKKDNDRLTFERETLKLEAQALRAQMNPHFIFNCLNSIKSLIQQGDRRHAVIYLTTFSKLLRQQLNNHLQEITLHEELETCQLYIKLEALRFGNRITYTFNIDPAIDLREIKVPPLIIQPFLENAIIHGILPKKEIGSGSICVRVEQQDQKIVCTIDDDGIGREEASRIKQGRKKEYQSKGTGLVQHRINLHNSLDRSNIDINILDKKNIDLQPIGTQVTLTFLLYP